MSELAQRIIASHKAAAKRAVFHLGKTRKLKLSSTESLELVASVLGVANWQTLLALANEGKGPRIDNGQSTAVAAVPAPADVFAQPEEVSVAIRLRDHFSTGESWGKHPKYLVEDWQYEVGNDDTRRGYWEWVEAKMVEVGEMLPWEREATFEVRLARLAGIDVEQDEDNADEWNVLDPHGITFDSTPGDEEKTWRVAANNVQRHLIHVFGLSQDVFDKMSKDAWLAAATSYFTEGPKAPESEQNRQSEYDELEGRIMWPGEMGKEERKLSAAVPLVRALGMEPLYSAAKSEEGKYWAAGFQFYRTEAEAWTDAAKRVRDEVLSATGLRQDAWGEFDLDTQFGLALDNSALAAAFKPDWRK